MEMKLKGINTQSVSVNAGVAVCIGIYIYCDAWEWVWDRFSSVTIDQHWLPDADDRCVHSLNKFQCYLRLKKSFSSCERTCARPAFIDSQ